MKIEIVIITLILITWIFEYCRFIKDLFNPNDKATEELRFAFEKAKYFSTNCISYSLIITSSAIFIFILTPFYLAINLHVHINSELFKFKTKRKFKKIANRIIKEKMGKEFKVEIDNFKIKEDK